MGKLSEFLKNVNDWILKHNVIDTSSIYWEKTAYGLKAHTSLAPLGGVGSGDYSGPFNVVKKDDTTVTIGKDALNLICLGVNWNFPVSSSELAISSTCFVCLKITYSGIYNGYFECSSSMPTQTPTEFYIALAYVTVTYSKISAIQQIQYGAIVQSGRVL